ncbi:MAG: hypothetical protein V2A78_13915 [bacterium]
MGKKGRAAKRDITQTRASIFVPPKRKFKWDALHSAMIMAVLIHVVLLTVFAIFRYEVRHKDAITEVYEVEMVPLSKAQGGGGGGGGGSENELPVEEQAPIAYKPQSMVQPEAPRQYAPPVNNTQVVPMQPQAASRPASSSYANAGGGHGNGQGSGNGSGVGPGSGTGTGGGHGSGTGTGDGSGIGPGQGGGTGGGGLVSGTNLGVLRVYLPPNSSYADEDRKGLLKIPNFVNIVSGYRASPNRSPIFPPGQQLVSDTVVLRFVIDKNGMTEWVKIEKNSNHPNEDEIARFTASCYQWSSPVTIEGRIVNAELLMDLSYTFDKADFK